MWTQNHEISSPNLYKLLIKTEIKGDTALEIKDFYNHINMCLNAETRLQEDLLSTYHSIKRHSEFEEYLVPYHDLPSYSWSGQTNISIKHSMLVALTNDTCVKYSMTPQAYNVVNTYAHEISG